MTTATIGRPTDQSVDRSIDCISNAIAEQSSAAHGWTRSCLLNCHTREIGLAHMASRDIIRLCVCVCVKTPAGGQRSEEEEEEEVEVVVEVPNETKGKAKLHWLPLFAIMLIVILLLLLLFSWRQGGRGTAIEPSIQPSIYPSPDLSIHPPWPSSSTSSTIAPPSSPSASSSLWPCS